MAKHLLGRPGSAGEHALQAAYGSSERAERYCAEQLLDQVEEVHVRCPHVRGTDDTRRKGGDFFGAADTSRQGL
ncbi:hypothetical protein [Kitasatospora mediocidica]|uniref:hypothetical protein n=1 Tax=Kitasatospora mediocidica TaxID=58352 RepID=UPI00068C28CB|nr:hypothetical protein [Kitasatospora mediocidica]